MRDVVFLGAEIISAPFYVAIRTARKACCSLVYEPIRKIAALLHGLGTGEQDLRLLDYTNSYGKELDLCLKLV